MCMNAKHEYYGWRMARIRLAVAERLLHRSCAQRKREGENSARLRRCLSGSLKVGIVLIVGSALCIIVWPRPPRYNNRETWIRTNRSFRTLEAAIGAYIADNGSPPAMQEQVELGQVLTKTGETTSLRTISNIDFLMHTYEGAEALGTHRAKDTHSWPGCSIGNIFSYYEDGCAWILLSPGPDKVFELGPESYVDLFLSRGESALASLTYDPTNGSISDGDILRAGSCGEPGR